MSTYKDIYRKLDALNELLEQTIYINHKIMCKIMTILNNRDKEAI